MSKTKLNANDYIDSTLYAKSPIEAYVTVDQNGNGVNLVGTIPPDGLVGRIYSWITRNGVLWWQIDNNTFPEHQYIFVKHEKGKFYEPEDVYQPPNKNTGTWVDRLLGENLALPDKAIRALLIITVVGVSAYGVTQIAKTAVSTAILKPKKLKR